MAFRLGPLRGPTLASCVLLLTQTACYKFEKDEEDAPPDEGYAWSETNGDVSDAENSGGSLRLILPKDIPGLHKEDRIRLEVNSICEGEGGLAHDESDAPVAIEVVHATDGSAALHGKRHRHPPHPIGKPRHFCVGPQFMDVYTQDEVYETIEVYSLLPGPAEVVVTIMSPFGPGLSGSVVVDIVKGETSPAEVKLHPVDHGGIGIDIGHYHEEGQCGVDADEDEPDEIHVPREGREELAWEKAALTIHESVKSVCSKDMFVAYNKIYDVWVGALTCSDDRYKLVMSDKKDGVFYEIVDYGGHGQDHCELVNPKFELPNDDDIKSACENCETGDMKDPIATPAYARGYVGESFSFVKTEEWADLTSEWYECGIAIK